MSFEIIAIDELLKRLDKYNHKELHVHHTWKPVKNSYNGKNGLELQESMKNYHVNVNKWSDIGQHVTLLPDGKFVTGRAFDLTPASIYGFNTNAFACEMLGNFDKKGTGEENNLGYDKFEGIQKESMLQLARYFHQKNRYIRFHRENSKKTCPGTSIDKDIFMQEVNMMATDWYQKAVDFVLYFQNATGITADGKAGTATLAKLDVLIDRSKKLTAVEKALQ